MAPCLFVLISLVYCKFDVLVMFLIALLMFFVSQVFCFNGCVSWCFDLIMCVAALVIIYVAILIIMLILVFSCILFALKFIIVTTSGLP